MTAPKPPPSGQGRPNPPSHPVVHENPPTYWLLFGVVVVLLIMTGANRWYTGEWTLNLNTLRNLLPF